MADEVNTDRAALTGHHAAHLARVLRARVGQEFDIATGESVRVGRVVKVAEDRVEFDLGVSGEAGSTRPVTLALAVFKFDRFEWAVEKSTELGVSKIVPVVAQRTDSHLATAAGKRVDRWRRIAREAAEQSRRLAVPELSDPIKLKAYLATEHAASRVVLAENEKEIQLRDLLEGNSEVTLAIGPEGGWADGELEQFANSGWTAASLGSTILRAETAAIAALAVVQALSE